MFQLDYLIIKNNAIIQNRLFSRNTLKKLVLRKINVEQVGLNSHAMYNYFHSVCRVFDFYLRLFKV